MGSRLPEPKWPPRAELKNRIAAMLTPSLRVQLARASNETCTYCRRRGTLLAGPDGTPWNLDHVIPVSRGGWLGVENVVLACRPCNLSKGSKTVEEWRASGKGPWALTPETMKDPRER